MYAFFIQILGVDVYFLKFMGGDVTLIQFCKIPGVMNTSPLSGFFREFSLSSFSLISSPSPFSSSVLPSHLLPYTFRLRIT